MLMTASTLQESFETGRPYDAFVELAAARGEREAWDQRYGQLELTPDQRQLVESFERDINVLCLTGTWCGDCALQGAAMHRIAEASADRITLRFLQRSDEHAELIVASQINQGFRVPVAWFMAEDFEPVSRIGDRTLSRYRSMARKALGGAAPVLAEPPADPVRAVLDEVLEEFERVHLLLRLSARLRERHGD